MPLWTLHCSAGSLDEPDRAELAGRITDLYSLLPRFYVGVVFHEVPPGSLYIGGERAHRFVRVAVDHIARTLPSPSARDRWMNHLHDALTPFMTQRDLAWELHIDETSSELWSIGGLRPPAAGSTAESRWKRENRPSPYVAETATSPERASPSAGTAHGMPERQPAGSDAEARQAGGAS